MNYLNLDLDQYPTWCGPRYFEEFYSGLYNAEMKTKYNIQEGVMFTIRNGSIGCWFEADGAEDLFFIKLNPNLDEDEFYFTTNEKWYQELKALGVKVKLKVVQFV